MGVVLAAILIISSKAVKYVRYPPSLLQELQPHVNGNQKVHFDDLRKQIMYEKFLISIADDALDSWTNSENQLESLRISIDQLQENNMEYMNQIDNLKQAVDDKSKQMEVWKSNYVELREKYAEVTEQNNSVHPTKIDSQQNGQQSIIMAVSIIIVLAILIFPIARFAYSIDLDTTNARIRSSIINALSPQKGKKTRQSFKDSPDPLSNVIVMDDTPTNSTPTSPKQNGLSLTLPDFIKNRNGIIFEEEDVKISEIDIPDTIIR